MENLDYKTCIHVACETLVITGISIYFQVRISGLSKRIEVLEKQNADLFEALKIHENFIKQLLELNGIMPVPPQGLPEDEQSRPQAPAGLAPAQSRPPRPTRPSTSAGPSVVHRRPSGSKSAPAPQPKEEESEPEYDPQQLDEELGEELEELCDGDTCPI